MQRLIQLAWAAGFWDGEGSASAGIQFKVSQGYPVRYIIAQLSQSYNPELITKFRDVINFGGVSGPYNSTNGGPYWRWRVDAIGKVRQLKDMLWPYLGTAKREQFTRCLEIYDGLESKAAKDAAYTRREIQRLRKSGA